MVNGIGLALNEINFTVNGLQAIVLQHEIDHANDILISDIGREIELLN